MDVFDILIDDFFSCVMSLRYKFADKIFFSFISQKQAVQVPSSKGRCPREGLPLCNKSVSIMGNTVKPLPSYSLRYSFTDAFTAILPNQVWELAF